MSPAPTLDKLKTLEPSLRAQGIRGLYLFGSRARGDAAASSDIDLMFDIATDVRFSLFDQARIARELGELLGVRVDLVPRRALHPIVKLRAEAEQITVFG